MKNNLEFELQIQTEEIMDEGLVNTSPHSEHYIKNLKNKVIQEIEIVRNHTSKAINEKDSIRIAHSNQRIELIKSYSEMIQQNEESFIQEFASGDEIDPHKIQPELLPVHTEYHNNLFKYASLQWSVPVSQGYGRRNKFLVKDKQNGKLIGIFALGDPVINLGPRDSLIGWDKNAKSERLYNVFDAFVLGAVEPYRKLIAGKLIAMVAVSNEVQDYLTKKYSGTKTVISGKEKIPNPALITTTSALGRSSIYNRLNYKDHKLFTSIGYSTGFGHFQFSESLFNELTIFVSNSQKKVESSFGKGANYKFRVIQSALKLLGLPVDYLKHGVGREVFIAPLANNWVEFLKKETDQLQLMDFPIGGIGDFYRNRWAIPRSQRNDEYKSWSRTDWKASTELGKDKSFVQATLFNSKPNIRKENMQPANIQIGDVKLEIGIGGEIVEGSTITDNFCSGKAYFSKLVYKGTEIIIADTTWSNGERDIQGKHNNGQVEYLDEIIKRQRIGIYPSLTHSNLSFMELRVSIQNEQNRSTVKKRSLDEINKILGVNIQELLKPIPSLAIGTREKLMNDNGRRRSDLCVLFPKYDYAIPVIIWTLFRFITLSKQYKEKVDINKIEVNGRAPEVDFRN